MKVPNNRKQEGSTSVAASSQEDINELYLFIF